MYGAILGDMIGAPYEFDRGNKSKEFEMFNEDVAYTDDTVMTIAVAEAFYGVPEEMKEECRKRLPEDMKKVLQELDEKRR